MTKRLPLLAVLALLSLAPIAHADEATKDKKIQELFAVTHVDHITNQMADNMLSQMNNMMKQQTAGADLNPAQHQIMSDFTTKVSGMVHQQLAWDKLKSQFTTLYANAYTEPEIDAILAFYRSPAGQTMLAKLPEINAKSQQLGQSEITTLIPQLRAMSQDFSKQMAAAATKPPAPTPAPAGTPPTSTPAARP